MAGPRLGRSALLADVRGNKACSTPALHLRIVWIMLLHQTKILLAT